MPVVCNELIEKLPRTQKADFWHVGVFLGMAHFLVIFRAISMISKTDVFRDVISFIINQCDPRRPKGAS